MKTEITGIALFISVSAGVLANETPRKGFPRWGQSVRGAAAHEFEADLDKGGALAVDRYFLDAGLSRLWRFDRMISLSAGFGQDDYRFSGLAVEPWGRIDNYRVGLFARWALEESKWTLFAGPSIRTSVENGADLDDGLTAAFFGGASYKFSDRLTIGPGLGVVGQLEDTPRYFPVVLVNWDITERLSLGTGGGLAATGGPGLTLSYAFSDHWNAGLTGRYESKRFRLNDEGLAPSGVGEQEYVPIIGSLTYILYPGSFFSLIFGYNMSGNLMIDDANGDTVYKSDQENGLSIGLNTSYRF
ncbi:MAG: hypothetical protein HKP10_00450 [Kiritimatiellales bacterium]|nr:hypothetical protein [Pontiella sp.]NNJ69738.1 hypothetical protein [Kiritimatiellales bacterium]